MLSGTFESFPLADVLGLIERAAVSGVLMVRAREVDGSLWFVDGALCAGEIGDLSGPVEGRQALEVRLLEVAVPLLRARSAEFEFRDDVTPPWPAPLALPVESVFEPARRIAREWAVIMTTIESFESVLVRTGEITTESITLSHLGFRVLEQVDGRASIRELAHRAGASVVAVAPEVRTLVAAGAVRVIVDADRALATARAAAERDRPPLEAALDVTEHADAIRGGAPVTPDLPLVTPEEVAVPVAAAITTAESTATAEGAAAAEAAATAADDALARERADLAARAGLSSAGPVLDQPVVGEVEVAAPERAQIVVDRSELLRMFSGLKDE